MQTKILIVDDEAEIVDVLSFLLRREGFDVKSATNGEEALALLSQTQFSGVICDFSMPKMDGLTLVKKIRENNDLVPFIFLSGYTGTEEERELINYGVYEVVHKPHIHLVPSALKRILSAGQDVSSLNRTSKEAQEFLEILHSSGKKMA